MGNNVTYYKVLPRAHYLRPLSFEDVQGISWRKARTCAKCVRASVRAASPREASGLEAGIELDSVKLTS